MRYRIKQVSKRIYDSKLAYELSEKQPDLDVCKTLLDKQTKDPRIQTDLAKRLQSAINKKQLEMSREEAQRRINRRNQK